MRKHAYSLSDEYGQDFADRRGRHVAPDTDEWLDEIYGYALNQLNGETLYQFFREYVSDDDLLESIKEWDEFYEFLHDLSESAKRYIA